MLASAYSSVFDVCCLGGTGGGVDEELGMWEYWVGTGKDGD